VGRWDVTVLCHMPRCTLSSLCFSWRTTHTQRGVGGIWESEGSLTYLVFCAPPDPHTQIKAAILATLGGLITKAGPGLKPFVPQLQTTFLKCLSDPAGGWVQVARS
jgi:hypothetical protein